MIHLAIAVLTFEFLVQNTFSTNLCFPKYHNFTGSNPVFPIIFSFQVLVQLAAQSAGC